MQALLSRLAEMVDRHPVRLLVGLLIVTVVLGGFATQVENEADLTAFAADGERSNALDAVQERFSSGGQSIQVIVESTDDDVLSPAGVQAAMRVAEVVDDTPAVADALADTAGQPAVVSFAAPVQQALEAQGVEDMASLAPPEFDDLAASAYGAGSGQGAQAAQIGAALLSEDRDLEAGSASAGLVLVNLDPELSQSRLDEAGLDLRDALQDAGVADEFDGIEIEPFSQGILGEGLNSSFEDELPLLLGLSFLLIIIVLSLLYRRFSDVAVALAGLVVAIVWTYGFSALMGPGYLELTGAFSQIAIVVPVLLVGLGVDYAVHLTGRYREERADGAAPGAAGGMAVVTVGGALVLATLTTMVGFLTNVASPLPPIADFGAFAAAGVFSAFIVFVLGVPTIRSLLDARRDRKVANGERTDAGDSAGLAGFISRAATVAQRSPWAALGVALAVTLVAVGGATQLETEFNQEDFIPEDSTAAQLLDDLDRLFGGDVDETSYVLIDGDLEDPAVANALLESAVAMGDTEYVRGVGGNAQATSPASLVVQTAAAAARSGGQEAVGPFAELGLQLPEGEGAAQSDASFAADADMAALYDLVREQAPDRLDSFLTDAADTGVISIATSSGQTNAADLLDGLDSDVAPLRDASAVDEVTVTSEPLVFEEITQQLSDSQTRAIVITLVVALVLLTAYYWISERRPLLGLVTMLPSILVVAWTLGTMALVGIAFNALTATVASLAIGIGVPYGIHVTHRFTEDREEDPDAHHAIGQTLTHTGGALFGSAVTTAAGFGVLSFSSLLPIQQFGIVTAITITYSLLAAVLVQPSALVLWDGFDRRRRPERVPQRQSSVAHHEIALGITLAALAREVEHRASEPNADRSQLVRAVSRMHAAMHAPDIRNGHVASVNGRNGHSPEPVGDTDPRHVDHAARARDAASSILRPLAAAALLRALEDRQHSRTQ